MKFIARTQHYWYRQSLIKFLFALLFAVFVVKVILILRPTTNDGLSITQKAYKQSKKTSIKFAKRGDILDRHGSILATDLLLQRVNLDPTIIQPDLIPKLAQALEINEQTLDNLLAKKKKINSKYLIIKKKISITNPIIAKLKILRSTHFNVCRDKMVKKKLSLFNYVLNFLQIQNIQPATIIVNRCNKEKISGVALEQETRRYYPRSNSLAPLLGLLNENKKGQSGIEGEFEQILAGKNGKTLLNFKDNNLAYFNTQIVQELKHGQNIILTIDANIQHYAYEAVKQSVKKHDANSGSAIILKANGDILAMVNYPAANPNNRSSYNAKYYRNRVLSDKIEPGSTMKSFTMLLALDKNKITATEDEIINVSKAVGHIKPDNKYYKMTVKKILQKSHNLGTVNISERLSKKDMYQTWNKLGFGHELGLMPNTENPGSLKHFNTWSLADKRTLSFGHGPMTTNLAQLARAYLVFANDGVLPALKLLKNSFTYTSSVPVFNKQSVAKIAQLLDAVVSEKGSGYQAQIKGYNIAGKTGTAEMVIDGLYNKDGAKRTFFVGFAPTKQPKYVIATRLDYPKKCYTSWNPKLRNKCEGSNSAAMTFKKIMQYILNNDTSVKLSMKH